MNSPAPPHWIIAARTGRHAVQQFEGGAVLIDVDGGDLLQLNASAAFVYAHVARGASIEELAQLLSARFGVAKSQGLQDVSSFLDVKPSTVLGPTPDDQGPFKYVNVGDRFAVQRANVPLFYVDPTGRWVTLAESSKDWVRAGLLWVAPKLLTLQGHAVLHASAVSIAGRAIAFSGRSGAGKTTLARAMASAGASLLAEDSFVVRMDLSTGGVHLSTLEASATRWADQALASLDRASGRLACGTLWEQDQIARVPLDQVLFLDAGRREGAELRSVVLDRTAATVALIQNLFWASTDEQTYRRALTWAATLSGLLRVGSLTVPAGIPQLLAASRRYAENMAS